MSRTFWIVMLTIFVSIIALTVQEARGSTDVVTTYQQRIHRAESTMRFFNNRHHRWMLALRHEDCWSHVPWSKTCNIARREYGRAERELYAITSNPIGAIVYVWGGDAWSALNVAWCESRYDPWASNGQYKGLFQMGDHERATYGDGRTPLAEAEAARSYYLAAGGWGPWECKP